MTLPPSFPPSPSSLSYMDDNDKGIRQVAVLACCKILEQHSSLAKGAAAAAAASGNKAMMYPFGERGE